MMTLSRAFRLTVTLGLCFAISSSLYTQCDPQAYRSALKQADLLFKSDQYKEAPDVLIKFLKSKPYCLGEKYWMMLDTLIRQLYLIEDYRKAEQTLRELGALQLNIEDQQKFRLRIFENYVESWQLSVADSCRKALDTSLFGDADHARYILLSAKYYFRLGSYQESLDILDPFLATSRRIVELPIFWPLQLLRWQLYYYLDRNLELEALNKELFNRIKSGSNILPEYQIEAEQWDIATSTRLVKNKEAISKSESHIIAIERWYPILKDKFAPRSYFLYANCLRNNLKIRKCDTVLLHGISLLDTSRISHNRTMTEMYYVLGANQRSFGNFDASRDYFLMAISKMNLLDYPSKRALALYYQQLGDTYMIRREYDLATHYMLKGYQIEMASNGESQSLWRHFSGLCELYYLKNDTISLRFYLEKWAVLHEEYSDRIPPLRKLDFIYINLRSRNSLGDPTVALAAAEAFLELHGTLMKEQGRISDDLIYEMSTAYYILGDKIKGLKHVEQRLANAEATLMVNKSPQNLIHFAAILDEAYSARWGKYLDDHSAENLDLCNTIFQKLEKVLTLLTDNTSGLKSFLLSDEPIFSIANVLAQQYQEFGDKIYINKALSILEGLKLNRLRTSITNNEALNGAAMPQEFKVQVVKARKHLNEIREKNIQYAEHADSLQKYSSLLADASLHLNKLVLSMEDKSDEYLQIKQKNRIPSLNEIQKDWLKKDETFLELYYFKDYIVSLVINQDSATLIRSYQPNFKTVIETILNTHTNYFSSTLAFTNQQSLQSYLFSLLYLDSILIRPIQGLLRPHIYYIPQGAFINIPLDILVHAPPEHIQRTHTYNFFSKQHTISTLPSISLMHYIQDSPVQEVKATYAFAPFATSADIDVKKAPSDKDEEIRFSSRPLVSSLEEVTGITKLMNGTSLIGMQASKSAFENAVPHARYLHIATHGFVDDLDIEKGYLAFQSHDADHMDKLYYFSIADLRINAELVVLSSCMSGTGKYVVGEGSYSLARAFQIAGAKNVISALWPVPDVPTKELMLLFYKEFKKGNSIRNSLNVAKNQFIQKYKAWAHPVYWAGFVLNGK